MKIENYLRDVLINSLSQFDYFDSDKIDISLEKPKLNDHGDFSTNIAMQLPAYAKKAPRLIAEEIVQNLEFDPTIVEKIDIAGPGFINFYLGRGYFYQSLQTILEQDTQYGKTNFGDGKKIQIEFVSANPTGPLNVVSARAAAIGDVLVNLFNTVGYNAHREYYVNDAGRQIRLLGESVSARYMELYNQDEPFPEEGYHGGYIIDLAKEIAEEFGDNFVQIDVEKRQAELARLALNRLFESHQKMMESYRVHFDCWFKESALREQNAHNAVLDELKQKDLIYEKDDAIWFKSEQFGDDKDRVLVTSDGNPTYFLIDIAYHRTKFERGYQKLYDLWGPDHHGYIARMSAAMQALGYPKESFQVEIIQQVNLLRGGKVIKMSKRAGKIIEMREVIDEVGIDAARFFFINRKISSHLDFDIDLAKKQTEENPVFYLQYAHARICSMLRLADEKEIEVDNEVNMNRLQEDDEKVLIKTLLNFPDSILKAAQSLEPHFVTNYLQELAATFHRFYHAHRVISGDPELTRARLALVSATKIVLANGFKILGITAPEKM